MFVLHEALDAQTILNWAFGHEDGGKVWFWHPWQASWRRLHSPMFFCGRGHFSRMLGTTPNRSSRKRGGSNPHESNNGVKRCCPIHRCWCEQIWVQGAVV